MPINHKVLNIPFSLFCGILWSGNSHTKHLGVEIKEGNAMVQARRRRNWRRYLERHWELYLMLVLPVAFIIIFNYMG